MLRKYVFQIKFVYFFLLFLISFSIYSKNSEFKQILKIREAINQIKPFKVNFIQQVYTDEEQEADISESGEILFESSQRLKWVYLDPDFKVFLLENSSYQFYDEDNEQLIKGTIKNKNQQWIWQLLFSDDLFQLYDVDWDESKKEIHIRNKKENGLFKSSASNSKNLNKGKVDAETSFDMKIDIHVFVGDNYLPTKIEQKDISGTLIIFYFNDYLSNVKISKGEFHIDVSEDVEIIQDDS